MVKTTQIYYYISVSWKFRGLTYLLTELHSHWRLWGRIQFLAYPSFQRPLAFLGSLPSYSKLSMTGKSLSHGIYLTLFCHYASPFESNWKMFLTFKDSCDYIELIRIISSFQGPLPKSHLQSVFCHERYVHRSGDLELGILEHS